MRVDSTATSYLKSHRHRALESGSNQKEELILNTWSYTTRDKPNWTAAREDVNKGIYAKCGHAIAIVKKTVYILNANHRIMLFNKILFNGTWKTWRRKLKGSKIPKWGESCIKRNKIRYLIGIFHLVEIRNGCCCHLHHVTWMWRRRWKWLEYLYLFDKDFQRKLIPKSEWTRATNR